MKPIIGVFELKTDFIFGFKSKKPITGVFKLQTGFIFVSKPLGNLSLVFLN